MPSSGERSHLALWGTPEPGGSGRRRHRGPGGSDRGLIGNGNYPEGSRARVRPFATRGPEPTSMAEARSSRPDVLLVVLDCVRSDIFEAEVARPDALPFLHSLRNQVVSFPRAASTASWTIPGHASLFTGLYPWDHGAHCRLGPILTREPETIAEFLQREGYTTGFYSANSYVQPSTGLARGFQETLWGGAREFFLRFAFDPEGRVPRPGGAPAHPSAGVVPRRAAVPSAGPCDELPAPPAGGLGRDEPGGGQAARHVREGHARRRPVDRARARWLARPPADRPAGVRVRQSGRGARAVPRRRRRLGVGRPLALLRTLRAGLDLVDPRHVESLGPRGRFGTGGVHPLAPHPRPEGRTRSSSGSRPGGTGRTRSSS